MSCTYASRLQFAAGGLPQRGTNPQAIDGQIRAAGQKTRIVQT